MAKKENSFIGEFKKFVMRGNVIDMAVGVAVGGAFTAIVNSFVADVFNPLLGLILGKMDFSSLKLVIRAASEGVDEIAIRYGLFIQKIIAFLITAFAMFVIIKLMNKLHDITEKKATEDKKLANEQLKN